jgi:hypothetical protein
VSLIEFGAVGTDDDHLPETSLEGLPECPFHSGTQITILLGSIRQALSQPLDHRRHIASVEPDLDVQTISSKGTHAIHRVFRHPALKIGSTFLTQGRYETGFGFSRSWVTSKDY